MLFKLQEIQASLNQNETAEQKEEIEKVSSQFPYVVSCQKSMGCVCFWEKFSPFIDLVSCHPWKSTASRLNPLCIRSICPRLLCPQSSVLLLLVQIGGSVLSYAAVFPVCRGTGWQVSNPTMASEVLQKAVLVSQEMATFQAILPEESRLGSLLLEQ